MQAFILLTYPAHIYFDVGYMQSNIQMSSKLNLECVLVVRHFLRFLPFLLSCSWSHWNVIIFNLILFIFVICNTKINWIARILRCLLVYLFVGWPSHDWITLSFTNTFIPLPFPFAFTFTFTVTIPLRICPASIMVKNICISLQKTLLGRGEAKIVEPILRAICWIFEYL